MMTSRSTTMHYRFALALVFTLVACSSPNPASTVSPGGPDRASFGPVARVLVKRCGSLDCHGSRYINMRLYGFASGRLAELPDTPAETTQQEIDADYDAVVGLEPEVMRKVVAEQGQNPSRLTLVRKGRNEEHHKGGQRIVAGDNADRCLLSWLAGAVDQDACSGEDAR